GPAEGQLDSRSWREDAAPVQAMLANYRNREAYEARVDREHPRDAAERQLLAALGATAQIRARLTLAVASSYIPLREVGRAAFLQVFDVARCMARRIGAELSARGALDTADDVFFLTTGEILAAPPPDARTRIAARRGHWQRHRQLELPDAWVGPA